MKKADVIKERFEIVTKTGLKDQNGDFLIPKEYDRLIKINNNLYAAVEIKSVRDFYSLHESKDIGGLTQEDLEHCWDDKGIEDNLSSENIDFYCLSGKIKLDKKICAYYYSQKNDLLVLLDENYKWCIGYANYDLKEVCIYDEYKDIDKIKEIYHGRFLLLQDGEYKIISFISGESIILTNCKKVQPFENVILVRKYNNKYGLINYAGEIILDFEYMEIKLEKDFVIVTTADEFTQKGVFSYTGRVIVPCEFKQINVGYSRSSKPLFLVYGCSNYGLYSLDGMVLNVEYSAINILPQGTMLYCKDGEYTLAKYNEETNDISIILPQQYDYIDFVCTKGDTYICVTKGIKYALYDKNGVQIRRFKYKFFIPEKEFWMYGF